MTYLDTWPLIEQTTFGQLTPLTLCCWRKPPEMKLAIFVGTSDSWARGFLHLDGSHFLNLFGPGEMSHSTPVLAIQSPWRIRFDDIPGGIRPYGTTVTPGDALFTSGSTYLVGEARQGIQLVELPTGELFDLSENGFQAASWLLECQDQAANEWRVMYGQGEQARAAT